jgi:hypothetical protein
LLKQILQEESMYNAMATSVVNLVDTLGMSEERIKQMFNIADGEAYQKAYDEMETKITDDVIDVGKNEDSSSFYDAIGLTPE